MARPKLTYLNKNINAKIDQIKACFSNLSECLMCCCKKSKDVEAQTEIGQQTSEINQEAENGSLIPTNDPSLNQPSNDMSKDSSGDVEDEVIKVEREKTAKENISTISTCYMLLTSALHFYQSDKKRKF